MLLLSLLLPCSYAPALPHRLATRVATPRMASKVFIDADGIFDGKSSAGTKPTVNILTRLEELKVLSALADAGILSSLESQGVFSKLEAAGAFSTAEKLLPLTDDLKLLAIAEDLLNVPSGLIFLAGAALLGGEAGLIYLVPDDSAAFVTLQAVTGVAAGLGGVTLLATSYLFGLLQGGSAKVE